MLVRLAFSWRSRSTPTSCSSTRSSPWATPRFSRSASTFSTAMRDEGKTIVLVTHDMSALQRFCHRAMLLERGSTGAHRRPPGHRGALSGDQLRPRPQKVEGTGSTAATGTRGSWMCGSRTSAASAPGGPPGPAHLAAGPVEFIVDVDDPQAEVQIHNEDQKAVLVASSWVSTSAAAASLPASGYCSLHLRQRAGPGSLQPGGQPRPPRLGSGRDGPLRPGLLVPGAANLPMGGIVDLPTDVAIERWTRAPSRAGTRREFSA